MARCKFAARPLQGTQRVALAARGAAPELYAAAMPRAMSQCTSHQRAVMRHNMPCGNAARGFTMVHHAKKVTTDWLVVCDAIHVAIRLRHCKGPNKTGTTHDNNTMLSQFHITLNTHRRLQTIKGFLESRSSNARIVKRKKFDVNAIIFQRGTAQPRSAKQDSSQRDHPSTRGHP
jgi:hypothetical protein